MTKRLFLFCWATPFALFGLVLLVFFLDDETRLLRDVPWVVDFFPVAMLFCFPMIVGCITLHTMATRRYRRLSLVPLACVSLVSLMVLIPLPFFAVTDYGILGFYWDGFEWLYVYTLLASIGGALAVRALSGWAESWGSRSIRVVALSLYGLSLSFIVVAEVWWSEQNSWIEERAAVSIMFGVAAFFSVLSIVWTSAENKLRRRSAAAESTLDRRVPVRLWCPKCGEHIGQRAGKQGRCGACGVGIQVLVDEPRCSCGYLLYDFTGERCPECGVTIPDRWRWDSPADPSANPSLSDGEPAAGPERD